MIWPSRCRNRSIFGTSFCPKYIQLAGKFPIWVPQAGPGVDLAQPPLRQIEISSPWGSHGVPVFTLGEPGGSWGNGRGASSGFQGSPRGPQGDGQEPPNVRFRRQGCPPGVLGPTRGSPGALLGSQGAPRGPPGRAQDLPNVDLAQPRLRQIEIWSLGGSPGCDWAHPGGSQGGPWGRPGDSKRIPGVSPGGSRGPRCPPCVLGPTLGSPGELLGGRQGRHGNPRGAPRGPPGRAQDLPRRLRQIEIWSLGGSPGVTGPVLGVPWGVPGGDPGPPSGPQGDPQGPPGDPGVPQACSGPPWGVPGCSWGDARGPRICPMSIWRSRRGARSRFGR